MGEGLGRGGGGEVGGGVGPWVGVHIHGCLCTSRGDEYFVNMSPVEVPVLRNIADIQCGALIYLCNDAVPKLSHIAIAVARQRKPHFPFNAAIVPSGTPQSPNVPSVPSATPQSATVPADTAPLVAPVVEGTNDSTVPKESKRRRMKA